MHSFEDMGVFILQIWLEMPILKLKPIHAPKISVFGGSGALNVIGQ